MDRRDLNLLQQESANVVCNYSEFVLQCFAQLRGREKECLDLVELCEQLRRKWKEASEHCMLAEEKAHRLEQEKEELRVEYELLKERYHDSNAKVGALISQRDDLKKEINEYQQRIRSIRNLMENELKDTAAFGRLMNLSKFDDQKSDNLNKSTRATRSNDFGLDVDFDKSLDDEEEIDEVHLRYNRTYQRRSRSVDPENHRTKGQVTKRSRLHENIQEVEEEEFQQYSTPPKRSREAHEPITTVTTITLDPRGRTPTKASVEVHRGGKRSMSEPRGHEVYNHTPISQRSFRLGASNADLRSPLTGLGSSWTKGRPILECDHYLESGKGALMKNCAVCNRTVTMQNVVKCKDCHIYLHNNCKARAPRPCLPFTADKTSKGTPQKKKVPRLADLCPTTPPLVPAILIRLVYEIENSRLEAEGLYRVPGNKDSVTKLLANMAGNIIPQLQNEHTEVLTSSVKRFLMNLKEPLIPNSSYNEFLQAVRDPSGDLLMKAFAELPEPNKDTLAFICLHLQKVAKFSHSNKMTIPNLAISIGVTVVRGGRRDEINTLDRNDYGAEAERQRQLMERLLLLPEDYWENYLNSRMLIVASQVRTPRPFTPRNADQSILGPVSETPPLNFTPTLRSAKRRGLNVNMY